MENLNALFYMIVGFVLRLAIPVAGTVLLVFLLRKLDERWQAEATQKPTSIEKPECWKIKDCAPEQVEICAGATSPLPCWQVYRLPNGYLREECISCEVFTKAPIPVLKSEPRRL